MPGSASVEAEKRLAAVESAQLVSDGMTVGLGTGSTVAYLLPALAERRLRIRCVATSVATETEARRLGLDVTTFDRIDQLDLAIDGADQVDPEGWLIKGGGGAHTRERIVAAAALRFVVIISSDKQVSRLAAPVPLELMEFGLAATLKRLPEARIRPATPPSPDGGIIADWFGEIDSPGLLARKLDATPGVVAHGLFDPEMVHDVIVGRSPA